MGAWKEYGMFCRDHDLNPRLPSSQRSWLYGEAPRAISIDDDRDLTWDEIEELTGGTVGTFNVPCPYCGPDKPDSTRFQVKRLSFGSATWHCFYCGASGSARSEEQFDPEREAQARRTAAERERQLKAERAARGFRLWEEAVSVRGSPVEGYLAARAIHDLPPNVDEVLRYHPRCPFGREGARGAMLALFRDVINDEPRAVHRTWITSSGRAMRRMALGPIARAAIKLWPREGDRLVIGEGIETVLSAALYLENPRDAQPLRPAWALTVANNVEYFPVVRGIRRLVILVDNDKSGVGRETAEACSQRWCDARREVLKLIPEGTGRDFNDIVKERNK